jgi:transglutaminase-like putative cysteine protease
MRASDRLIVAVVVAVWLASFTLTPLTVEGSFLGMSWILIGLLAAVTLGLRRLRLGAGLVFGVQILILGAFLFLLASGTPSAGQPWYRHYIALWESGIEHMQTQAAPMEPNEGITVIFITVIGVIWILTDLLVSGLARPMWGLAPPLTLFLVPAVGLGSDTGVASYLCIAVGYLGILLVQGLNMTARWTRGLSRDSSAAGTSRPSSNADGSSALASRGGSGMVWRSAALIGVPALVGTLVLGVLLPTLALPGFGFGNGPGGGGRLQLTDPTLDLRRNLNQPSDTVVIQYQTDRPSGMYLRMASLPELSSSGWRNVPMQLASGGTLPAIPGLSGEPTERRDSTIRVLDFRSEYLPLPYAPRSFIAPGEWAYDPNSLVVLAGAGRGRSNAIRNLTYSVQSVDIAPEPADLVTAVPGTPNDVGITGTLPEDFPQSIVELTKRVTARAETPIRKAAAIQAFLRDPRQFTYSTEPLPGTGYRALENFLLQDQRGYCEQFAAAMAAMARALEIPSRVAVGFLPGERRGDTWEVSIRDMHAWPELYFAGYGWVRFEPTPSSVTGTAPSWTVPGADEPTDTPSDTPSDLPSAANPNDPEAPSTAPTQQPTDVPVDAGFDWARTLLFAALGLVVLAILAAPATIRVRRRNTRLTAEGDAAEQVESAWAEIRDTVVDHGGSWPGGSPRAIGTHVAERLEQPESASMGQIATLVERSRYARSVELDGDAADLPTMTTDIRRGIAAPQSRLQRALAVVFPRSVFPRPLWRSIFRRRG